MARDRNSTKFLKEAEEGLMKTCQRWVESDELKAQVLASEGKWDIAIALYIEALKTVSDVHIESLEEDLKERMAKLYAGWAAALKKEAEKVQKRNNLQEALALYNKGIAVAEKAGDEGEVKSFRHDRDHVLRELGKDAGTQESAENPSE
jgi:tetratricopeptide (TPR) repeat protein